VEEVGYLRAELEKYKNRLRQFQLNRQKISTQVNTSPRQLLNTSSNKTITNAHDLGLANKLAKNPIKTNKVLSLKQLREMIDEIYASKARFDQKCVDNQLPRETMEQHLYTYLNQKYGLKNLILEWASAIIQAIKKFSAEDNSVAVFGKILRNEVDEEFRFVQRQLCDTVAELLRVYVKGKYPRKVDSEIMLMLQKKMGNAGVLAEEEWVDIIKYMYNKEDSVNVIVKVQEAINKLNLRRQKNKKEQLRDNKIPYNEFLKVLLDFQLKGHERFLAKFVKLFRQYDSDRNGILNELEFRKLLTSINPDRTDQDIDYWLDHIDPWNNQQITFSECVTFLSADLVKMMQDSKREEEIEHYRGDTGEEEEDSDDDTDESETETEDDTDDEN
jgi:Ca2+-binding EF-hand superfamily protein